MRIFTPSSLLTSSKGPYGRNGSWASTPPPKGASGSALRGYVVAGCRLLVLLPVLAATAARADDVARLKAAPSTPADAASRDGVAALQEGRLAAAEEDFNKSLRLDPNHLGALLGLAEVSMRKTDYKAAGLYLKRASAVAPANAEVEMSWGHYLFFQKRYAEAEAALKKAAELDLLTGKPQIELGDLYLVGMHKPQEAIKAYQDGLAKAPANAKGHYGLANALTQVGSFSQAESQFQDAARLDPKNPVMYEALGVFYVSQHQFDRALDAYSKALAVQPKFLAAYVARGDIFLEQGHADKALAEYEAALKVSPKFADAYTKMGAAYERKSQIDEAERAYRSAIQLDKRQAGAYNELAWLAANRKSNLDEALTWAERAVQLNPGSANFQDTLGWVYRARGEADKAISVLQKAGQSKPPNPEIFYHLGVVYAENGHNREAREYLARALASNRDFDGSKDAKARLASLGSPN